MQNAFLKVHMDLLRLWKRSSYTPKWMNHYDLYHLPQVRFHIVRLTTQRLNSPSFLEQRHEDVCDSGGKAPSIPNTGQLHAPADLSCHYTNLSCLTTMINKLSTEEETSHTSHTALNHFSKNIFQYKLTCFQRCASKRLHHFPPNDTMVTSILSVFKCDILA
jgi:hypothetical protein